MKQNSLIPTGNPVGFPRHRFYDNLLRYKKRIGLHGYKEYIESIKKGMIIFDGI